MPVFSNSKTIFLAVKAFCQAGLKNGLKAALKHINNTKTIV